MANKSILEYEITSPSNTSTVLGEKDGKVKRFNVSDFGGNGSSSGGGASIIDVDEFPSNPSTTAIYRNWQVMKAEWVYKGQIVTDGGMTCEVVDTLPETGNVCYTGASMYSYYQRADGEAYGYVDTALSSQMSVPVGWYPAATLFGALGYAYNGMIDKIADASDSGYCILLTKKPFLYCFHNNGTDIEQTKILTSKDNRAEGGGIIYATELPSTPAQAIYVITQDEVVKVELYSDGVNITPDGGYCEIVDELPENPEPVIKVAADMSVEYMYTYYHAKENEGYVYIDETAASLLEAPTGWLPASAMGAVISTSVDDMTESGQGLLLTKQPKTRVYVPMQDGTFLELTSGIRTRFDKHSRVVSITEV